MVLIGFFLIRTPCREETREANIFLTNCRTCTHSTRTNDSNPTLCTRVDATHAWTFPPSSNIRIGSGNLAGTTPTPRRTATWTRLRPISKRTRLRPISKSVSISKTSKTPRGTLPTPTAKLISPPKTRLRKRTSALGNENARHALPPLQNRQADAPRRGETGTRQHDALVNPVTPVAKPPVERKTKRRVRSEGEHRRPPRPPAGAADSSHCSPSTARVALLAKLVIRTCRAFRGQHFAVAPDQALAPRTSSPCRHSRSAACWAANRSSLVSPL